VKVPLSNKLDTIKARAYVEYLESEGYVIVPESLLVELRRDANNAIDALKTELKKVNVEPAKQVQKKDS